MWRLQSILWFWCSLKVRHFTFHSRNLFLFTGYSRICWRYTLNMRWEIVHLQELLQMGFWTGWHIKLYLLRRLKILTSLHTTRGFSLRSWSWWLNELWIHVERFQELLLLLFIDAYMAINIFQKVVLWQNFWCLDQPFHVVFSCWTLSLFIIKIINIVSFFTLIIMSKLLEDGFISFTNIPEV